MTDTCATFDWAARPLGAKGLWPAELRTTVALYLGADDPTAVLWGDEWRVLYNDAFNAALKRDTPVLGQPAANVWNKWWPPMAKVFAQIVATGSGITETNKHLQFRDGDLRRDEFWNYNFSPVSNASGRVLGIFAGAREITEGVLRARRWADPRTLGRRNTCRAGSRGNRDVRQQHRSRRRHGPRNPADAQGSGRNRHGAP